MKRKNHRVFGSILFCIVLLLQGIASASCAEALPSAQVTIPDQVTDSLGQYIPGNRYWDRTLWNGSMDSEPNPDAVCEIEQDSQGRVTKLIRTGTDGQYSPWQYVWEYDEQGRFTFFCYEEVQREAPGTYHYLPRALNPGSFVYFEDGSRDCVEEVRCEDIWSIGTFHYDAEGFLTGVDGRNLYNGIGTKFRIVYSGEKLPAEGVACQKDRAAGGAYQYIDYNGARYPSDGFCYWRPDTLVVAGTESKPQEQSESGSEDAAEPVPQAIPAPDEEVSENPFPVTDSLGQYVDLSRWNFGRLIGESGSSENKNQTLFITTVTRDENGRIQEVTRQCRTDPGLGIMRCTFAYDESGRFTEIQLTVEGSEVETLYGFPGTENLMTFSYAEDRSLNYSFAVSSFMIREHGSILYDADGELTEAQTFQEMYCGDENFAEYDGFVQGIQNRYGVMRLSPEEP